jgi:hypothetical protein
MFCLLGQRELGHQLAREARREHGWHYLISSGLLLMPEGVSSRLGARLERELGEDIGHMVFGRARTDE